MRTRTKSSHQCGSKVSDAEKELIRCSSYSLAIKKTGRSPETVSKYRKLYGVEPTHQGFKNHMKQCHRCKVIYNTPFKTSKVCNYCKTHRTITQKHNVF